MEIIESWRTLDFQTPIALEIGPPQSRNPCPNVYGLAGSSQFPTRELAIHFLRQQPTLAHKIIRFGCRSIAQACRSCPIAVAIQLLVESKSSGILSRHLRPVLKAGKCSMATSSSCMKLDPIVRNQPDTRWTECPADQSSHGRDTPNKLESEGYSLSRIKVWLSFSIFRLERPYFLWRRAPCACPHSCTLN